MASLSMSRCLLGILFAWHCIASPLPGGSDSAAPENSPEDLITLTTDRPPPAYKPAERDPKYIPITMPESSSSGSSRTLKANRARDLPVPGVDAGKEVPDPGSSSSSGAHTGHHFVGAVSSGTDFEVALDPNVDPTRRSSFGTAPPSHRQLQARPGQWIDITRQHPNPPGLFLDPRDVDATMGELYDTFLSQMHRFRSERRGTGFALGPRHSITLIWSNPGEEDWTADTLPAQMLVQEFEGGGEVLQPQRDLANWLRQRLVSGRPEQLTGEVVANLRGVDGAPDDRDLYFAFQYLVTDDPDQENIDSLSVESLEDRASSLSSYDGDTSSEQSSSSGTTGSGSGGGSADPPTTANGPPPSTQQTTDNGAPAPKKITITGYTAEGDPILKLPPGHKSLPLPRRRADGKPWQVPLPNIEVEEKLMKTICFALLGFLILL
ncbi:MAG: hypothetical protein M1831_006000 [Alyxoria varia]|nr:MAG: hypothetical protein M1831_006000 [Alyxoria varia]